MVISNFERFLIFLKTFAKAIQNFQREQQMINH